MRQQPNIDQNLVAQHINVHFVGNIADELHEQIALVQCRQIGAIVERMPDYRRT